LKDLDELKLKNEIDDIMERVDSILGKIEEFYPIKHEDMDQNDAEEDENGR
jgi:hypothetical protein